MIPSGSAISDVALSGTQDTAVVFAFAAAVSAVAGGAEPWRAATDYFVTMDFNAPPSAVFLSTLRQNFTCERSLIGSSGFSGLSVSFGRIELDNTEAGYDADASRFSVDGETVTIKVGEVVDGRMDYDAAYTVVSLVAVKHVVNEDTLTIEVRDKAYRMDVPARKSAPYAGTGNLEGGPEVAGKNRPWWLGWCFHVPAAPLLPAELIDQVNDGPCETTAGYDDGGPYTLDGDVPDLIALRAAVIVPGHFVTCNALGLARRGGRAFGTVAYDVKGYDRAGNFIETTADILREVILAACDLISEGDIAENTFDLVNIQQPAARGYGFRHDSEETVSQFGATWMRGVGGYVGCDRLGFIEIGIIDAPGIVASARYDETRFLDIRREPLPGDLHPPPQRVRLTYAHNWSPLSNVVGEVTDAARIASLKDPYQIASSSGDDAASILIDYPSAGEPEPVPGHFKEKEFAEIEAQRQLDLAIGSTALYRGTIPLHPFVHDLLETIHVTRPRFELADGRMLRLVAIKDMIESRRQEVVGLV